MAKCSKEQCDRAVGLNALTVVVAVATIWQLFAGDSFLSRPCCQLSVLLIAVTVAAAWFF